VGKRAVALITDMDQPLGRFAGHAHEVMESMEVLRGRGARDLRELSLELSAWMFFLGERSGSVREGRELAARLIASGQALEKFREAIALQGGDPRVAEDYGLLPQARNREEVRARTDGFLSATQCRELGVALAMLGGGREKKEDAIDPAVGLEFHKRIGDRVAQGETLVTIHYNAGEKLAEARERIARSFLVSAEPAAPRRLIRRLVGSPGEAAGAG
jgi:pyrimidine-nucleoside phosphorylase